jgi:magnesium transporter
MRSYEEPVMDIKNIMQEIQENFDAFIQQNSPLGQTLWHSFLEMHPADIADFVSDLDREQIHQIFEKMPRHIKLDTFRELSDKTKVFCLSFMNDHDRVDALNVLPVDELTDMFDLFSDEELKHYLNLLHKKSREQVLSLLKFDPESAGGIMDIDVITYLEDFTVEKGIQLLQRLQPKLEIHRQIYVVDQTHRLVGHVNLEDLLLKKPKDRIGNVMHENKLVVLADRDREAVAKDMIHYGMMTVPVTDQQNHLLGVISSDTLVDVLVEEASEDVQKMAALAPLKYPYFETSFFSLFFQRSYILMILLIIESFSSVILHIYQSSLTPFLYALIPMLISVGGNTSSQTSAVVIQGMATGDINETNRNRFLRREFLMASMLSLVLGITGFIRVFYFTGSSVLEGVTVSISLSLLVLFSVMLGSFIPFILRRFNIDPAFSAGPFLATAMDILGVIIYCYVSRLLLF